MIEFLRNPITREQVETFIAKANQSQTNRGYALWAAELKATGDMMGFIGLQYTDWKAHFTPAVEIGWRLGSQYWGNGYATEGAKAALDFGFNQIGLSEIVSLTVPGNKRSIRVMEKIGMTRDFDGDFAYPLIAADHPLSRHVLYRISASSFYHPDIASSQAR